MTDHTDDIRPRIDEHGVGWCSADCPSGEWDDASEEVYCLIDHRPRWGVILVRGEMAGHNCPHHARLVAAERDRLRAQLDKPLDHQRTSSCGHTWTLRHTACPVCFIEFGKQFSDLRAAIRTALAESTTYDEVEARLVGLVEGE